MTTTREIIERTGLTFRQIDHWAKQGYLRTDPSWDGGQGRPREYLDGELKIAFKMRDLVACGFTPRAAHDLARGDKQKMMRLELTLAAIRVSTDSSLPDTVTT